MRCIIWAVLIQTLAVATATIDVTIDAIIDAIILILAKKQKKKLTVLVSGMAAMTRAASIIIIIITRMNQIADKIKLAGTWCYRARLKKCFSVKYPVSVLCSILPFPMASGY